MQKLLSTLILAGTILRSDPVLVTRVSSGNAITVASIGGVRLLGIEADGSRARERLESLVIRRWVRLEYDRPDAAAHTSRRQAYVVLDTGECVNLTLVRDGLARVARGEFARRAEFVREEAEAKRFRRGIWSGYTADGP